MAQWIAQGEDRRERRRRALADPNPEAIAPDQIQLQLERIIASSAFDASRRNRAFLRFIVEESLAGRADRIKAYTIATSVLGRDEAFDPQSDPIVRIEASRLRRSLERYYLKAGQHDPIRIEIPKWGYVPSFQRLPSIRDEGEAPQNMPGHEPPAERSSLPSGTLTDETRRGRQFPDVLAPASSRRVGGAVPGAGGQRARHRPLDVERHR